MGKELISVNYHLFPTFEVFTAVIVTIMVFWVVTPYYLHSKDGCHMSLRNFGSHLQDHTVLQSKRHTVTVSYVICNNRFLSVINKH
jgi:ABC-type sulfate transport system permease component